MNNGTFEWTVEGVFTVLQMGAVLIVSLALGMVVAVSAIAAWLERRNDEQEGEGRE